MPKADSVKNYPGGVCYFCGNKAEEQYHSGSYQTYLECTCKERRAWLKLQREADALMAEAVARRDRHNLLKEIEDTRDKVRRLEETLNRSK